ncbi:MAG: hypothetical protein GVY32_00795 [Gammaproteobacteria bacterium]|jgi:hypothetical protein|nr:hypothetical protein [Gammaproteobacteria bacterium]
MTRIRFHIGAHKTATTHLQMTLARCRLAAGTRYVPLKRLRRWLTSPVRKGRPFLPWHRWYRGTWLLSDENILGNSANVRRMYRDPASALRYFADGELAVFMAVRSYDTFLPSAWGERLWRHPFEPFEASIPDRRWTDIVADLQASLPGVPIHVWRYEDYRDHAREIIQFYADGAVDRFPPELPSAPKSGFSARAIEELSRFAGKSPGRARIRRTRARFPVGPEFPRFDPWTDEQKATLRAMYAEDLASLDERVHLWTP